MCVCVKPTLCVFDRVVSTGDRPQLPVVPVPFLSPGLVEDGRQHAHHSHAPAVERETVENLVYCITKASCDTCG